MLTVEQLQGIISGLTAVVKQQAEAQKATNTRIAQLTEALLAHGGPPTVGPTNDFNFEHVSTNACPAVYTI